MRTAPEYKPAAAHGFTLIEIMAVVVIISIAAAVAMLSVDVTGRQKARTFAKELQFTMRHISNEAVLTGNPYALEFDLRAQRLTPLVYSAGAWRRSAEVDALGWGKHFMMKLIVDGVDLDEQEESRADDAARVVPKILFWTTGLWQPAGGVELLIEGFPYLRLTWTASGKMKMTFPREDEP